MSDESNQPASSFQELLAAGDLAQLNAQLRAALLDDAARFVDRLDEEHLAEVLDHLDGELMAGILTQLPDSRGAELLQRMSPTAAATALRQLPSNDQVDLYGGLGEQAAAILAAMPAEAAQHMLRLSTYAEGTAGGLMTSEFLTYRQRQTVAEVIDDLRAKAERYARFDVQYAYVLDDDGRLVGTLRLRDLLLLSTDLSIRQAMNDEPQVVSAADTLDQLERRFDRLKYLALPVVDDDRRLLGVVLSSDVEEALADRSERTYLLMSGLLGGEELRSMRWKVRVGRRLPWLAVSLLLSTVAASVIGWYDETLAAVFPLAVFLPVISGVSGNAGNQSLALSIRELSLGLLEPHEFGRVVAKELLVAAANGLAIALLLGSIAYAWQGSPTLAAVIGIAILSSTMLAAILGGVIPLALKRIGWDPALASGPILFTTVDLCGFLFTLMLADWVLA